MARLFDDASTQSLANAAAAVTAVPLTMACWVYSDDATIEQVPMSIVPAGSAGDRFALYLAGDVAGDFAQAAVGSSTIGTSRANATAGYSVNTWHHIAGVFTSATLRAAFIDGGNKGTNTANNTPAVTLDRTCIGAIADSLPRAFFSGRIAEAAIWNVALSDEDIASLAKGFSPCLIRPQSLVAYWPLFGNGSPEPDRWKNRYDLTLTNGPTKADHPRIYCPDY